MTTKKIMAVFIIIAIIAGALGIGTGILLVKFKHKDVQAHTQKHYTQNIDKKSN